jgi:RNA polymerase subunit RPABC4/transcription elongation factor Spt4
MTDDCPDTLTPCNHCQKLMRRRDAHCPSCEAVVAYRQSRGRMVAARAEVGTSTAKWGGGE